MNMRKGMTVAKVGEYRPGYEELAGRTLALEVKKYPSINAAKKANGLNAKVLKRGEHFPPTPQEAIEALRANAVQS